MLGGGVAIIEAPLLKPFTAICLTSAEVRMRMKRNEFWQPRGTRGDAYRGRLDRRGRHRARQRVASCLGRGYHGILGQLSRTDRGRRGGDHPSVRTPALLKRSFRIGPPTLLRLPSLPGAGDQGTGARGLTREGRAPLGICRDGEPLRSGVDGQSGARSEYPQRGCYSPRPAAGRRQGGRSDARRGGTGVDAGPRPGSGRQTGAAAPHRRGPRPNRDEPSDISPTLIRHCLGRP